MPSHPPDAARNAGDRWNEAVRPTVRPHSRSARAVAAAAVFGLAATLLPFGSSPASAATKKKVTPSSIVTPGNFTGLGFDQCVAPTQKTMSTWLNSSPFLAVGIYISGNSRHCRNQPNLSDTWVKTQLSAGWKILPIALGPQASCSTRYPKYKDGPTISAKKANNYAAAAAQGTAEADQSAADAAAYGIAPRSTIWYDLEAFDIRNVACRESALRFVSAWNTRMRALGYVPGYYSSAASGIRMLDDVRANNTGKHDLPNQVWIADWNGVADTESTYIRSDGWRNGGRMKQFRGGHNETWGGVTINIDSNFLDLGKGSRIVMPQPCGSANMNLTRFGVIDRYNKNSGQIRALQCALKVRGYYTGSMNGVLNTTTKKAVANFQRANGFPVGGWRARMWMKVFTPGSRPVLKVGSASTAVLRLQRALNATTSGGIRVTGTFNNGTKRAVIRYQKKQKHAATGIVTSKTWVALQTGKL